MSETPDDELQRLAALRRYQILDTLPEPQFDNIAELARTLFEAPIALISLVDERRQWFKAHLGIPVREIPRQQAPCAQTIRGVDVLVVADARQDERFRDSPLVAGEPHIRFYAGAPLRTSDGFNLGALCVMDSRPRHDVTARQIEMLSGLARVVMREIEARLHAEITRRVEQQCRRLLQAATQYRGILEGGNEGIWVLDVEARTTYVNARMADMLGCRVEEMLGRPTFDFMDAAAQEQHERLWAECKSGASSRHEFRFRRRDGTDLWTLVKVTPIHDADSGFAGALAMCIDISDRKQVERKLQEREATFRYLAEHNPSPMWVYDYETLMFLEVNEAATSHYGFSRAEFLAMQVTDIRPLEEFAPLLANPSTERGLRRGERRHRTKARGLIDVETASSTIRFSGRDAVLEVIHDITDRKRAEEALRVSEALLKDAQHRAKLAYWIWDPATQSYTFGDAYREVIGADSMDDVRTDEQFLRFVHEADRDRVAAALERGRNNPESQDIEYRVRRADGRVVWLHEICEPEFDIAGRQWRMLGVVQDISDQKRAVEALRESEARLRHAGRMAGFGYWLWFADAPGGWASGRSEYSVEGAAILGHDPADLTMGTVDYCARIIHPEDGERVRSFCERMNDRGDETYSVEYRIVRPDGEIRNVLEFAENSYDDAGGIVFTAGTIQDLTELKRMEEQLRQAQKTEAIVRITGGVAHDFNSLLAVIGGNAEMLAEKLKDNRSLHHRADMIIAAAERGAGLVSRLLSFARRRPLAPKRVDVNSLIAGLRRRLRRSVGHGIDVEVGAATGLWMALVDPTQLETALLNLAINARDAMPFGGRIRIETANVDLDRSFVAQNRGARPGAHVMIAVIDSGTGMTPEVAARAFEPFFTTKDSGKGPGLGLSEVNGFIEQSGGYVQIESRVGKGTAIHLYLPRAEEQSLARDARAAALPTGRETILVVEDDDLVRLSVESLLDALGYAVVAVAGAETALDVLRAGDSIDLLFTDIDMPGEMNGLALAIAAGALRPGLPVLLTTGGGGASAGDPDLGFDVLHKPYQHAELASRVRALLDRHAAT